MASRSRSRSGDGGLLTGADRTLSATMDLNPRVSIVMPICNEAAHLERALDAIAAQTYPADRIEILVVDGGSTDGTTDLVRRRMSADARIRLLGGVNVNTPLAMQLGIKAAAGEIIAKIDGHGWINEAFLKIAVAAIVADPELGCIGGRIHPVAETPTERAIAVARFSRLGVGGGVYTLDERLQETDTVQCGVYRRTALVDAGGFDPSLPFGEDEEANFRLRQRGWRIQLDPAMQFTYRVRPSVRALFRQYFRYGRARVAVVRLHPSFFRPKHAAPAALVLGLAGSVPLSFVPGWRWLGAAMWIGYLTSVSIGSSILAVRARFGRPDLVGLSLIALHLGYGLGSLGGMLDRPAKGKQRHGGPQRAELERGGPGDEPRL